MGLRDRCLSCHHTADFHDPLLRAMGVGVRGYRCMSCHDRRVCPNYDVEEESVTDPTSLVRSVKESVLGHPALKHYLSNVYEDTFFGVRVGENPEESFIYVVRYTDEATERVIHEIVDTSYGNQLTWGHRSQTTKMLADTMLRTVTQNEQSITKYGDLFYERVISRLPRNRWTLTFATILAWIEAIDSEILSGYPAGIDAAVARHAALPGLRGADRVNPIREERR